jgi:hypothetical protein
MANHETINKLIESAGSQLVSVRFVKQDGSQRQLTFNPKDFADIKGTGTPCSDPNIFRIRDVKLGQWRSFDARRVISVRVNGKITKFNED